MVLDNCEHIIGPAAELAEALLKSAEGVQILATSREPLRVHSEWVHRLAPLTYPPFDTNITAREALGFSAVELLVERIAETLGGFTLSDRDARHSRRPSADVSTGCRSPLELVCGARGSLQYAPARRGPSRSIQLFCRVDYARHLPASSMPLRHVGVELPAAQRGRAHGAPEAFRVSRLVRHVGRHASWHAAFPVHGRIRGLGSRCQSGNQIDYRHG